MRILAGCRSLLESLTLPVQMHFASACIDPLLSVIREELEPPVLGEAAAMLQTLSDGAVQFADYQLASRIFSAFGERTRSSSSNEALAELLEPKLAASVQRLLQEDLASGNLARQEKAAQVLASMGPPAIPLLINVIKGQRDYRTRQLAAKLLAGIGPEAARRLKHEILFEVTVVQRTRILEVIDSVTRDLRDELSYCLGDVDAKVRRAAFQLADRLKDESLITILVPFARSDDLSAAKGAIRSLANFRGDLAVAVIVSVLGTAKDAEVAIACCQALARTGNPSCVDALADVLFVKKRALDVSKNPFLLAILRVISPLFSSRDLSNGDFLSRLLSGRRWGQQVRATAALALGQIPHPRAAELLSSYVEDPDPRVRQLAQSALMRMQAQVRRKEPASEWPRTPDGAPDPSGEPVT